MLFSRRRMLFSSRLSGTLAILAMDRFERNNIYDTIRPVVYSRYVDDIGTVVSSIPEASQLLETLNSRHDTIKFELELPAADGYLPLLDAALKINQDGSLSHRLHTKSASKQITMHFESHHPESTKVAIVKNELKRAETNSIVENITGSTNAAVTKLVNNGYPANMIKEVERVHRGNSRTKPHKRTTDQLTFRIPFINNKIDNEIRRALDRHKIEARIVHPKPRTLLQLAQPKMEPTKCKSKTCPIKYTDCTRTHVVYEITCELCGECYVGSTVRALHDRAREHIASAKNQTNASAMGVHYKNAHKNLKSSPNYASRLSAPRRKTSCG